MELYLNGIDGPSHALNFRSHCEVCRGRMCKYARYNRNYRPPPLVTCNIPDASEGVSRVTPPLPKSTMLVGEKLVTSCAVGYEFVRGDKVRQCGASGDFEGQPLQCQGWFGKPYATHSMRLIVRTIHTFPLAPVMCTVPPLSAFVEQLQPPPPANSLSVGGQLETVCVPLYRTSSGDSTRQCLANGSLSGEELVCVPCAS